MQKKLIESIRDIKPAIRPKLKHVQLRVYINGKQEQFPTKVRTSAIDPNNMDVTEDPIHYYAQHLYACAMHSETASQCRNSYKLAVELGIDTSINYETSDFIIICDKFRDEYKLDFSNGYLRQYVTIAEVIKLFKPNQIVTIQDVTTEFISNFVYHLSERSVVNGTINTYLKNLKRIVQYAKDDLQLKTSNPKFPKPRNIKDNAHVIITLSWEELKKLEQIETLNNIERKTLDCFLFICYTGVRGSDLQHISIKGLTGDKLQFFIQKQQKTHTLELDDRPLEILRRVQEFKPPTQQKMNHHIKILCERAGIDTSVTYYKSIGNKNPKVFHSPKAKKISVHTARRTWATLAYHHTKDIALVSDRIGHKDHKTTLRYIGVTELDQSKLKGLFSY